MAFRRVSRSRILALTAMALMAGVVFAAATALWMLRQDAIADTEEANHRLAVVLAETTTRTFQAVDLVLLDMLDRITDSGVEDLTSLHDRFRGDDVHEALTKRLTNLPQVEGFVIIGSDGRLVNMSGQPPGPEYHVADRAYFQHFVSTPDPGPYVSEPIISRAYGIRTIILSRRITAPNGNFLGVVNAHMRLGYLNAFFTKIGFSDGTGTTIVRRDGMLLVQYPKQDIEAEKRIPEGTAWYAAADAGGGNYISSGAFTHTGPAFVSTSLLKAYPIAVNVSRNQKAALARWWRQAIAIALGVLCGTLSLTLLLRAMTRQLAVIEASQAQIRRQVEATKASEALLTTTLEHMNQGLIMIDGAGVLAVCNKRAMEMLGLPAAMVASRPKAIDCFNYSHRDGAFKDIAEHAVDSTILLDPHACNELRRPDGMVLEMRTAPLPDGGLVRTFTDITARAAAEEMLGLAASHDQLTGLANRNGFNGRLDAVLATARRGATEFAVLCLDLDRFKVVNDTLGHEAGDQLLIQAAQRMREIVRVTDIIGRLGGDEFAIVLSGTNLDDTEQICRRLLESVRMPYVLNGEPARIGVSIGIALYPADGGTGEQLLRNADSALYRAKAAGRNTWCAYASADGEREQQRMQLEHDVRTAIELSQFTLAYQPICEAASSEPVAFEALLRWTHAKLGPVSPTEFIPIAEQTGLIIPLGRWVLQAACAEAAAWALPLRVAVNLSPAQFRDRELLSFIRGVLSDTGLPPARLDLEVTEGVLLEDVEDVLKTMQGLRDLGVHMVLDDFGTAHANLSYLRGFPFDTVKIDRSFLRALNNDRQARALVEAMLAMARALGLDVIGEGVETPEQLALLNILQCRWVQGYLLGRPASGEATRASIWQLAADKSRPDRLARLSGSTARA